MSAPINKIRYWLSYLWDQPLETVDSFYNNELEVCLSRGRLQLNTPLVTYSHQDLYNTFYKSFKKINIRKKQLKKVLVLGFGLGSVPFMLENSFQQNAHYIAVEIDEAVVSLAKKYVTQDLLAKIDIYCADAHDFVLQTTDKYDLIAMDVFIDQYIPNKFRTPRFLRKLKKCLHKQGYLLYNTLNLDETATKFNTNFFQNRFQKIFVKSSVLQISANQMLIYQHP